MFSLIRLYITLFFAATLATLETRALAVRDTTSDVATTKGGILVKNGKQTSCELGVIDSMSAFVSAPCLDHIGTSLNQSTVYEVYLDAGINNTPAKYTVTSITLHPDYNAILFLNPIAILQFNSGSTASWSNPIAINRDESWGDVLFTSRGITDMDSMEWRTPLTVTNDYLSASDCLYANTIIEANENDMYCTNAITDQPFTELTTCAVPYGSVDVYISGKLYVAGIYVFTATSSSNNVCTLQSNQNSLYVVFADYIAFANKVLGRSISYYPDSNGIAPQSNSSYSMSTINLYDSISIKAGDFYGTTTDVSVYASSTYTAGSATQSQSSSGSSATHQSRSATDAPDGASPSSIAGAGVLPDTHTVTGDAQEGNQNKSSKKGIIIGVVCGVLGSLIIAILSWYFCRRRRKARRNICSDKDAQIDIRAMLVVDSTYVSMPPSVHGFSIRSFLRNSHLSIPLKSATPAPQSVYRPPTPALQRTSQLSASAKSATTAPQSVYRPPTPALQHTWRLSASARSAITVHTPVTSQSRDPFDALEYHQSPLYNPRSPSIIIKYISNS